MSDSVPDQSTPATVRRDALDFYADPDPFDKFPWTYGAYVSSANETIGQRLDRGSISTPNGKRPDGSQHTYWSVVSDVWEPIAVIICNAVNRVAHERYGTPLPVSAYTDEYEKARALRPVSGACGGMREDSET